MTPHAQPQAPASPAGRAVVFDLDGVLMHSGRLHERAYRQALAEVGVATFDYLPAAGRRTEEVMAELLRNDGRPVDAAVVADLCRRKRALVRAMFASDVPVDAAAAQVVDTLGKGAGLPLAIATSASAGTLEAFLAAVPFAAGFAATACGDEVAAAKPAPDVYLLACARLGANPAQCWAVEDSTAGVRAAAAAGLCVIAIDLEGNQAQQLRQAGAAHVVDRLADVALLVRCDDSVAR